MREDEAARRAQAVAWAVIADAIWPGDEDGENRLLNALTDGEMEWAGRAIDGIVEELLREDDRASGASGTVHLFADGRAAVYLDSLEGFDSGECVEVSVRRAKVLDNQSQDG